MTIEEVMTRDVITVAPTAPIHQAAQLMVEHGVSGLPVVDDDGRLVGIISEGDLILRQTRRGEKPWWSRFFENGEQLVREYQRAMGTTVGEVMTRDVITISPVWGIETAATILQNAAHPPSAGRARWPARRHREPGRSHQGAGARGRPVPDVRS